MLIAIFISLALIGFGAIIYEHVSKNTSKKAKGCDSMSAHTCEQIDPNCFRCSLNVDELEDTREYHHNMTDLYIINDALEELLRYHVRAEFAKPEDKDLFLNETTHYIANKLWPSHNIKVYCETCHELIIPNTEHLQLKSSGINTCTILQS